jgi:hypothetical protein
MCEPWPGPRCNDKTKDRDIKLAQLKEIAKTYEPDSLEYVNALNHLIAAQQIYDTTPKGISELQKEFHKTHKTFNPALISRVIRARVTRNFQTEALKEIQSGRVYAISLIASLYDNTYSQQEVETIIACAREAIEESAIKKAIRLGNIKDVSMNEERLDQIVSQPNIIAEKEYETFTSNIYKVLLKKYDNRIPENILKQYNLLESMSAPTIINMRVYSSLGNALEYSKNQLVKELGYIAAIQDTTPEIAAEYYEHYREQYLNNYLHLPLEQQPMPPRTWIEGVLFDNGMAKYSQTNFIPRDPASLYAIYRMRVDLNAIPDYLKKSSKMIAIYPKNEGYLAKHVTRTGKQLGQEIHSDIHSVKTLIEKNEENSVLLMLGEPQGELKEYISKGKIISIHDFAAKHFDFPKKTTEAIAEALNAEEDPIALYNVMRKKMLKTWSSKPLRSNIAKISFTPTGDSKYVNLLK